ncbi:hypothetical protein MMC19_005389 [Ptychographa xylographoides]|nr:hypothetical protein [Ptychographa xylographoides]
MAKTAKLKKNATTSQSIHSRAAKRASLPSINLDKSLRDVKPPTNSAVPHPPFLSTHHGAGIVKKKGKGKALSRQQRLRREKGLERAEAVMDKTERKLQRSSVKVKVVKERSAAWDDLNGKIQGKAPKSKLKNEKEDEWEDEDMSVDGDINNAAAGAAETDSILPDEPTIDASDIENEVL